MKAKTKALIAAGLVAVAATAAGVAMAGGGNDDDAAAETQPEAPDRPITGSNLERAKQAALDHVGEGRVTETEEGDEESYYEVEVTRDDGSQVDVQLDEEFKVVGAEDDGTEDGSDD